MIPGPGRTAAAAAMGLILGLLCLAWSPAVAASALELDGAAVAWSRLDFRAADRPDSLGVEVSLTEVAPGELAALLKADPGDDPGADPGNEPVRPADATVMRMTSTIEVFLTGRTYRTDVWFYASDAVPLERRRDKIGGDPSRKIYRFLSDGARRLRLDPDNSAEAQLPPEQWSRVRKTLYPYGAAAAGCPVVTDPNLLLVIASAGAVTGAAEPIDLCAFNKEAVYRVRLSAAPVETMEVDHLELRGAERRQVRGRAAVRKVRIQAFAPEQDGGAGAEPFEFFEMGGDIEIDLDAETGLPLRITGEVSGLGRVAFALVEAELRP